MRRSRIAAYVTSLLLAVGLTLTGAATAQASSVAAGTDYVALGDSYSSGVGSGSYLSSGGDCKRSTKSYPYLWQAAHSVSSFSFLACSGATTSDVMSGQLSTLTSATDLVSISVGGNDAGFADVMTTCVLQSDATCLARIDTARAFVDSTLPGRLDTVYSAIRAKAPAARVVVLGYPRFYRLGTTCLGLSATKRAAINDAADRLDAALAKRAADHGFAFGDVRTTFTGHELCSGSAWLHSLELLDIGESYHPTAAGQSGGYLPSSTAWPDRPVPPHRGPSAIHAGGPQPYEEVGVASGAEVEGVALVHVTDRGRELDVVCTGERTSAQTRFPEPVGRTARESATRTLRAPRATDLVRQSETGPPRLFQRYSTVAGARPTVMSTRRSRVWRPSSQAPE